MTLSKERIGSSSGGTSGVYDPRVWDNTTGQLAKRGRVLSYDTFDNSESLDGFADHFHYNRPHNIPSLTTQYPFRGPYAMVLSPSELPYSQAEKMRGAGGYKRLGHVTPPGVQSLSAMFAIRAGSGADLLTSNKKPFQDAWIGMDAQPTSSNRFFGMAQLRDKGSGTCAWFLRGGYTSQAATSSRADIEIPGTEDLHIGLNEMKMNYGYARLTVDLAAGIAGTGYYREFQFGDKIFDLRGLIGIPYDTLLTNGTHDTFTGGNNIGYGISRSTINPEQNITQMIIGESLFTVGDLERS